MTDISHVRNAVDTETTDARLAPATRKESDFAGRVPSVSRVVRRVRREQESLNLALDRQGSGGVYALALGLGKSTPIPLLGIGHPLTRHGHDVAALLPGHWTSVSEPVRGCRRRTDPSRPSPRPRHDSWVRAVTRRPWARPRWLLRPGGGGARAARSGTAPGRCRRSGGEHPTQGRADRTRDTPPHPAHPR